MSLSAGTLVAEPTPRYRIHGTKGSYIKCLDPQEDRLKAGETPRLQPGEKIALNATLREGEGEDAPLVRHDHPTLPGDYLAYYQGVSAAIRDKARFPWISMTPCVAWRSSKLA